MKTNLYNQIPMTFKVRTKRENKSIALQTVAIDAGLKWRTAGAVIDNVSAVGITFYTSNNDLFMQCNLNLKDFENNDAHLLEHNDALMYFLEMIALDAQNNPDPVEKFIQELKSDKEADCELLTNALLCALYNIQATDEQIKDLREEVLPSVN